MSFMSRDIRGMLGHWLGMNQNTKRVHAIEYGWPDSLGFNDFLQMYRRHPLARAAVEKTKAKTWQTNPVFRVTENGADLNGVEKAVMLHLTRIRFWQQMAEVDGRSMVGAYGGLILRVADGRDMDQPIRPGSVAGIEALVEAVPCWQNQLKVHAVDTDFNSDTYGKPLMWEFTERNLAPVGGGEQQGRRFKIHADRVIILSRDGTTDDRSQLEPGYNTLIDIEKIMGAGAEGFFKNSKGAPVLTMEDEAGFEQLAESLGVEQKDVADKINKLVNDWSGGFDKSLLLSRIKAEFPTVRLPQPEQFWAICVRAFAASWQMPVHILTGMQTGERASTEDSDEWLRTCEARRNNELMPSLQNFLDWAQRIGVIAPGDWHVQWESLIGDGPDARLKRAGLMALANKDQGQVIFTPTEIRTTAGHSAKPNEGAETIGESLSPEPEEPGNAPEIEE